MASVHAVNRAREQALAAARAREVTRQAQRAEQARQAREREARARMRDLERQKEKERQDEDRRARARALAATDQKKGAQAGLLGQLEDDNDAQWGAGLWGANDDQAAENDAQKDAKASKSDPAGYGDTSSVDAVNKDWQDRNATTAKQPSQYGGRKTYKTKGPITVTHATTTALVDGLNIYAKWHALDENGKRMPSWEMPNNKGQDISGHASPLKSRSLTLNPPFHNPFGWEVDVSIPPQPAYSGNAGTSWVDVTVSK